MGRDFLRLWLGQSVSVFGNQVILVALPLTAVLALDAGANEMGLLRAVQTAPILLFSLAIGVWIDRVRRRPLLVIANLGRGLCLAAIPALAITNALRLEHLYLLGFAVGGFEVIFIVAYQAVLPALVERERLAEANGRLQMSDSSAQIAGPAIAGVLVSAVTAPIAIAASAASFLLGAAGLASISAAEPAPTKGRSQGVAYEVREGIQFLVGHPVLRPVVFAAIAGVLAFSMYLALIVLFHARALGLDAATIGTVFAVGGMGALAGALVTPRIVRRVGLGPSMALGFALGTAGMIVTALASGPPLIAATIAAVGQFVLLFVFAYFNVIVPTLRQTVTPHRLLGRVNATYRFLVWGTVPLGSLLGGALGETFGLRAPLIVAAMIDAVIFVAFIASPVARMRETPAPTEAPS